MIKNYQDYLFYVSEDEKALHLVDKTKAFNLIWLYQKNLRKLEYLTNSNKTTFKVIKIKIIKLIHQLLGVYLGFSIYPNNFGYGLSIAHRGTIVVNEKVRIGNYCRIHVCVNIGTNIGESDSIPNIGDRVYIGPGAKIFGKIEIGDGIIIGANSVVNKSFKERNITIAGVPAKKISDKGSPGIVIG